MATNSTSTLVGGEYQQGDIAWMLASAALVWIMTPGVGFLYSGLSARKNALSMIFVCIAAAGVVTLQWWLIGFSLAFSNKGSPFIGSHHYGAMNKVFQNPDITEDSAPHIPAIVFAVFQLSFACMTAALAVGAIAQRGRLVPTLIFVFIWTTLVYDPIAYWTWNAKGWAKKSGVLDFAGGTVVHISSGTTALAISLYLGPRHGHGTSAVTFPPHNTTYVVLGTMLLWFGWFGFNGGSALGANMVAAQACFVTTVSASAGGLSWMLLDWRRRGFRKVSIVCYCNGAISALVAITPAAGYVDTPSAFAFGVVSGIGCKFAADFTKARIDDALDIFAMHAVGGVIGNLLTGLFAQSRIVESQEIIKGGWLDHNWRQLGLQLANSSAGMAYAFVVTSIILYAMHAIPAIRLRQPDPIPYVDHEGIDWLDMDELAYDYVHERRNARIPQVVQNGHGPSIPLQDQNPGNQRGG